MPTNANTSINMPIPSLDHRHCNRPETPPNFIMILQLCPMMFHILCNDHKYKLELFQATSSSIKFIDNTNLLTYDNVSEYNTVSNRLHFVGDYVSS